MADTPMRILSVCSGIDGIELGLRLAMPGSQVLGYIEREAYAAAILLERMAEKSLEPAPVFCGQLEDVDAESLRGYIDLVSAGIPCQPFSTAGKRFGHADERAIWPAFLDLVAVVSPALVFLENVPGFLSFFEPVGERLCKMGYEFEAGLFSAEECGAPQRRVRLFVLADRHGDGCALIRRSGLLDREWQALGNDAHGRGEAMANADESGRRSHLGHDHESGRELDFVGGGSQLADPECLGGERRGGSSFVGGAANSPRIEGDQRERNGHPTEPGGDEMGDRTGEGCEGSAIRPHEMWAGPFPPGPSDADGWRRLLAERPDLAPTLESTLRREASRLPDRMDRAMAYRRDRLRALGNSVVPLVAAHAFVTLAYRILRRP